VSGNSRVREWTNRFPLASGPNAEPTSAELERAGSTKAVMTEPSGNRPSGMGR